MKLHMSKFAMQLLHLPFQRIHTMVQVFGKPVASRHFNIVIQVTQIEQYMTNYHGWQVFLAKKYCFEVYMCSRLGTLRGEHSMSMPKVGK